MKVRYIACDICHEEMGKECFQKKFGMQVKMRMQELDPKKLQMKWYKMDICGECRTNFVNWVRAQKAESEVKE